MPIIEVWILKVYFEADFPNPAGWAQAGVFDSKKAAVRRLKKLQFTHGSSRLTKYSIRRCDVETETEEKAA